MKIEGLRSMPHAPEEDVLKFVGIEIGARAHRLDQVPAIARMGFPFAEISLIDPSESQRRVDEMIRLRESLGIRYLVHGPNEGDPWDIRTLREEFLPVIKTLLHSAVPLKASAFTLHFWLDPRFIQREILKEKYLLLGDLCEEAQERGVCLCLENLSERPEDFAPVLESHPGLALTLDLGHGQILSSENTSFAFIRTYPNRIRHVHLHDNRGGHRVKDDLHLPIGEGTIDFPRILKALLGIPYGGTMTLEVPMETLVTSRDRVITILKGLV